MKTEQCRS